MRQVHVKLFVKCNLLPVSDVNESFKETYLNAKQIPFMEHCSIVTTKYTIVVVALSSYICLFGKKQFHRKFHYTLYHYFNLNGTVVLVVNEEECMRWCCIFAFHNRLTTLTRQERKYCLST